KLSRPAPKITYWLTPRPACSTTRSSMKRARATMDARKCLVPCGSMSGRRRQPSSGAASRRPISSSSTCGGGSTCTCMARHKATRTAVLSAAALRLFIDDFLLVSRAELQVELPPPAKTTNHNQSAEGGGQLQLFVRRQSSAVANQVD